MLKFTIEKCIIKKTDFLIKLLIKNSNRVNYEFEILYE